MTSYDKFGVLHMVAGGSTVSSVLRGVGFKLSLVDSSLNSLYCGVSSSGLNIVQVNRRLISPICVAFTSDVAPLGLLALISLIMSFIAAVSLSLSLGKGKGTLSGNHVSVSTVLVPLVSAL